MRSEQMFKITGWFLASVSILFSSLCVASLLYLVVSFVEKPETTIATVEYECGKADKELMDTWVVNCVTDQPHLIAMCTKYSYELFCEVRYD